MDSDKRPTTSQHFRVFPERKPQERALKYILTQHKWDFEGAGNVLFLNLDAQLVKIQMDGKFELYAYKCLFVYVYFNKSFKRVVLFSHQQKIVTHNC